MTREEIIEAIQNDNMMPFLQDWEARDIVDFVLKNIQPSLPDGLEEEIERQLDVFPYMKVTPELPESRLILIQKQLKPFARHFAEWGARHSINWGDVQLLDTFILELSREEKDGADWEDSEKFYTEVLRRFHEFNDKKIPEIVAEWGAKHLKK